MAELKLISPGDPTPAPGEFTETETAQTILRCLNHVHANAGEDIGLICGAPGIGMTETLRHFAATHERVFLHKAVANEGGTWNTANALCYRLGEPEPNGSKLDDSRWRIAKRIGEGGMLIIDKAEHLVARNFRGRDDWQVFDWLRALSEDWGVGLVFCGSLDLREAETALPGLWSFAHRTILLRPRKGDVAQIGAQWGFGNGKALELLSGIARRGGALHKVTQVCRKAQAFAGNRKPTFEHLMAAAEYLNLLPEAK